MSATWLGFSGASAAVRQRLDVFVVLVVAFVAGNFGGITRDLLIGAVPPAALVDWRYLAVSLLAGMITFRWHAIVERLRHPVLIFDAMGLALLSLVSRNFLLFVSFFECCGERA